MPNDCWNYITIYAPADTINRLADAGSRIADLVTKAPEDDFRFYGWQLDQLGQEAIQLRFASAWSPPVVFFDRLVREYPIDFMKVTWSVEDGVAGIWVAEKSLEGADDGGYIIQSMHWDEGCLEEKAHRWR